MHFCFSRLWTAIGGLALKRQHANAERLMVVVVVVIIIITDSIHVQCKTIIQAEKLDRSWGAFFYCRWRNSCDFSINNMSNVITSLKISVSGMNIASITSAGIDYHGGGRNIERINSPRHSVSYTTKNQERYAKIQMFCTHQADLISSLIFFFR